jgi:hypothetical protein
MRKVRISWVCAATTWALVTKSALTFRGLAITTV